MLWLREKWKWGGGIIAGIIAFLAILLKDRGSKKNFENAKKLHDKENKINKDAFEEMTVGLERILEDLVDDTAQAKEKHKVRKESLKREKDQFIKDSKENENLSKDIADHLGATHVESD